MRVASCERTTLYGLHPLTNQGCLQNTANQSSSCPYVRGTVILVVPFLLIRFPSRESGVPFKYLRRQEGGTFMFVYLIGCRHIIEGTHYVDLFQVKLRELKSRRAEEVSAVARRYQAGRKRSRSSPVDNPRDTIWCLLSSPARCVCLLWCR